MTPIRTIAVDWSGAMSGVKKKIWLAEARDGELVRLECGRDREQLVEHLIAESKRTPNLAIGLDFAFSLPSWYLTELGVSDANSLWERVSSDGEAWLAGCEPPFWGRPGRARPPLSEHFRRTESDSRSTRGIRPKSTFQIGGAGAVGTGSLRGMPYLKRLRDAGFCVWPFDVPRLPVVVEIYPRLLTGAVNKGSQEARHAYLLDRFPELDEQMLHDAVRSDDAFDAAVSAFAMDRAHDSLASLPIVTDPQLRLEGQIWVPAASEQSSDEWLSDVGRTTELPEVEIDQESWRALIATMLPSPVKEFRHHTLVGGDPIEVVAEITPHVIRILQRAVRWEGHTPESNDKEIATFDPRRATPREVSLAVVRARAKRIATYQWCERCHQVQPPEWMHSGGCCQSCAQQYLGIIY